MSTEILNLLVIDVLNIKDEPTNWGSYTNLKTLSKFKYIHSAARGQRKRTGGIGLVAEAGSALGSAVYCIAKCETLLTAANEDVCDKKALVSVLVKLKDIKDNLGK